MARAYFVDITDDEAWSFYNVKHFWYVETLCTGNTHWFNFIAIKTAILLGCEKAWQIRWFSVLSGIGFLFVVYLWIKTFTNFSLKLFAFSITLLHPYLLEYLTLARGYSAGLSFMLLSILFLIISDKEGKKCFGHYALFFAGLSALANFNFFYYFSAFCVFYLFISFQSGVARFKSKWFYIDVAYVLSITILVLRALLFIRECSNDIADFGGDNLVTSLFGSYIELFIYRNFQLSDSILFFSSYVLFIIVMIAAAFGSFNKTIRLNNKVYYYASFIFILMLGLMVFNKLFFKILYPTDRTALMFYPLIAVIIVEFIRCVLMKHSTTSIIFVLISMAIIINFSKTINFKKGMDHLCCNDSKSYFEYIDSINTQKVGIPWDLYCVYLKYYKITGTQFHAESINSHGYTVRWVNKNSLEDFDHLLLLPPYNLNYYKPINVKFEGVKYFSLTGALIVKVIKRD